MMGLLGLQPDGTNPLIQVAHEAVKLCEVVSIFKLHLLSYILNLIPFAS